MRIRRNFTLDKETDDYLTRESEETGLRKSVIVRQAIKARMKEQEKQKLK